MEKRSAYGQLYRRIREARGLAALSLPSRSAQKPVQRLVLCGLWFAPVSIRRRIIRSGREGFGFGAQTVALTPVQQGFVAESFKQESLGRIQLQVCAHSYDFGGIQKGLDREWERGHLLSPGQRVQVQRQRDRIEQTQQLLGEQNGEAAKTSTAFTRAR